MYLPFCLNFTHHPVPGRWGQVRARAFLGLVLFVLTLLCFFPRPADAQRLIRDTEIENAIRVYLAPLYTVAGLDPLAVKIHIVNDPGLNAFVSNGQQVFIHTGLLTRAEHPGQVIGVLAHELGHITGGHLARFGKGLEDAQDQNLAALLLGIPAAILTGRADAALAASALGQQLGERSLLRYTREMEQGADQAGVDFLDQAGFSSRGLLEFMKILRSQQALYSANRNPYIQTHPLTEDRMRFVEAHLEKSPLADAAMPADMIYLHDRMRAKLVGFLSPEQVPKIFHESDQTQPANYARIVAAMQNQDFETALNGIEAQIRSSPQDPFLHELRGDILRNAGRVREAIEPYSRAVELLPWAALVRVALAQVMLETGDYSLEDAALDHAVNALRYEKDLIGAWRIKGIVHERRGERGQAVLAQAEVSILTGKKKDAADIAKRAMALLPEGSASWLRAQDINIEASRKDPE